MKIAVFDVDNTIIKGQSQRLLLSYLFKHRHVGLFYYSFLFMWFAGYRLRLVRDPRRVVSLAYSFLKDKSIGEIESLMADFFDESLTKHIFSEALREIERVRADGFHLTLVSNAPSIIVKPLAARLGMDTFFCTQLEIVDGRYSGRVQGDIMYNENKRTAVLALAKQLGCQREDMIAYGDHVSDIPVLEAVGRPVAVNPSSGLSRIARAKGWEIHNWSL